MREEAERRDKVKGQTERTKREEVVQRELQGLFKLRTIWNRN